MLRERELVIPPSTWTILKHACSSLAKSSLEVAVPFSIQPTSAPPSSPLMYFAAYTAASAGSSKYEVLLNPLPCEELPWSTCGSTAGEVTG